MKNHRIARYLAITAAITFAAYMLRSITSMLMARQSIEALATTQSYFTPAVNLLAAIITAALNRRYTFRSTLAWGISIPVMAVLEMLFDTLTGMLWSSALQAALTNTAAETIGQTLQIASYTFNLVQFALWAMLAYLFQRYVLYRETLDSLDTNDKGA